MAIAVDQGFAERIRRIEAGKQWAPEGVIVSGSKGPRRRLDINRGSRRMTWFLSMVLLGGIWIAVSNHNPELAGQVAASGSSLLNAALEAAADG